MIVSRQDKEDTSYSVQYLKNKTCELENELWLLETMEDVLRKLSY